MATADNLISILLPTRNRARMLRERAIPAVLGQTHQNWELLIVGDCCTDDTEEVVRSFNDPRIKFFNLPEKIYHYPKDDAKIEWLCGPCLALNKALDMVTGDYIARIDDDDLWINEHLELSFAWLQRHKSIDFISWGSLKIENSVASFIEPYRTPDTNGSVQTWVYRAIHKDLIYNPDCWKKENNRNNELDWFQRFFYKIGKGHIGYGVDIHAIILPRPGLTTIGSKAYLEERNVSK